MARYREKPTEPEIIEAIEWTGNNLEEIKEFLGDCFVEVEDGEKLWYRRYPGDEFIDWIPPEDFMIIRYEGRFGDMDIDDFNGQWELIEEEE